MTRTISNRATLLSQLGQVFRERGYEGATLSQLAAATGLGKASLYHHFPGGKAEMAEALMRDAVTELQQRAFARLAGPEPPAERLQAFINGFADYLERAGGQCLLGVLALTAEPQPREHPPLTTAITEQFRDWQLALARVFEEMGDKPKRAARRAAELLNQIYGAQLVSKLLDDTKHLRRTLKRLAKL